MHDGPSGAPYAYKTWRQGGKVANHIYLMQGDMPDTRAPEEGGDPWLGSFVNPWDAALAVRGVWALREIGELEDERRSWLIERERLLNQITDLQDQLGQA